MLCAALRRIVLTAVAVVVSVGCLSAQTGSDAARVFAEAPASVFPTIDRMTRLDMIDYFNSGSDKPSKNAMAGDSRILSLSDRQITVQTSGVQTVEISLLPQKSDTLLVVVTTLKTPAPDSSVKVFSTRWEPVRRDAFKAPLLADWVLPEGKGEMETLETLYPFTLASATFNPDTGVLTLTNHLGEFLPEVESGGKEKLLRPVLEYRWDGKQFR